MCPVTELLEQIRAEINSMTIEEYEKLFAESMAFKDITVCPEIMETDNETLEK